VEESGSIAATAERPRPDTTRNRLHARMIKGCRKIFDRHLRPMQNKSTLGMAQMGNEYLAMLNRP